MNTRFRKQSLRTVFILALAMAMATGLVAFRGGCATEAVPPPEMTAPEAAEARAALAISLDAWKNGNRASGVFLGESPRIAVVDSLRRDRPLRGYEIEGALRVSGRARPFAVRLDLGDPDETVRTRYMAVGRDPLWVFCQDDYDRMIHWEHKMEPARDESPAAPSPSAEPKSKHSSGGVPHEPAG